MKRFLEKIKEYKEKKGITVLIASLVASILLSIGLSIFYTTVKDLFFAATARESEIAFYAADAAAECAQYWDFKGGVFATSSESIQVTSGGVETRKFYCAGRDITESISPLKNDEGAGTPFAETNFKIEFTSSDQLLNGQPVPVACADVTVRKTGVLINGEGDLANPNSITTIDVLGRNSSCATWDDTSSSLRRVERGIKFSY